MEFRITPFKRGRSSAKSAPCLQPNVSFSAALTHNFLISSSDEEEDEAALMSGLNNGAIGAPAGGPQLVTQIDPNIKKQLILALKMKRTYKSALTECICFFSSLAARQEQHPRQLRRAFARLNAH